VTINENEKYVCPTCETEIFHQRDPYTGCDWVKCVNINCKDYDKPQTYIDLNLYRKVKKVINEA